MTEDNRPIGVFDSGVGGLTVVSEIIKILPNEDIIYFGDTARVPYGSKSTDIITKFSYQIVNFLLTHNVKAIVIACNTVSSNSYEQLSGNFQIPFIEVVTPGAESCVSVTANKKVGVIGTEMTIKSGAYESGLKALDPDITVYQKACPLFVPLAEEGWTNNEVSILTAKEYLQELLKEDIDSLILGCTHYPLLYDCIKTVCGEGVSIVNPANATAKALKRYLNSHGILHKPRGTMEEGCHQFFVSDNTDKFSLISTIALGCTCEAKKIDIEAF